MTEPFEPDRLLGEAMERHGGRGAFDPSVHEPLAIICRGLDTTANLSAAARTFTHGFIARLLDGHLALADLEADETMVDEQIVAPIFMIGAPRTGTTALHRLLASDTRHRVPQGWEFLYPAPPPAPFTPDDDPRIVAAGEELGFPQAIQRGLRSIHTYDARMAKECLSAMSFSFRSEEFISRYRLPDYVDWFFAQDKTPMYDTHRRVLRSLQLRRPTARWVLKSPVHLQAIPELVAAYPDASFIATHRDPVKILGSVSSLIVTLRRAFSEIVDPQEVGRYHLDLYARSLDAMVDHVDTLLPPERTVHIRHTDLLREPVATVESVYDALAIDFGETEAEAATTAAGHEREDAAGAHRYELGDFGLDAAEIDARFARYVDRFLA